MRSLFRYSFIASLILIVCVQVKAQNPLELNIGYQMNIPAGSFRNYISNPAYKGFTAGLAVPLNDQFSLGLSVAYNDYYQKYSRAVYDDGKGSAISAVISNSIQQVPIMLTASYTLLKKGFIRPYIGAGGGMNLISFDQYLGEYDNPQSKVKATLEGEAGFYIPLRRYSATAIKIGANYQYAPYAKDINLDNWGIHAGIQFALR
jgi:opacity protein-like surface antigen